VYGASYERLRTNIRALHPELDEWMIVEGYGKVLSRPGLDLARRELCIVAACAAAGQERQLHSHLHGAVNAGASAETISAVLDALAGVVQPGELARAVALWKRVGAHSSGS
jgi:4-carboxymuconolactone decarboxylase